MLLLHGASSMASVSHRLKGKPKNSSLLEMSPVSKLFFLPALIRQLQGSKSFHSLLLFLSLGTFFPKIYQVSKASATGIAERGNCLVQLLGLLFYVENVLIWAGANQEIPKSWRWPHYKQFNQPQMSLRYPNREHMVLEIMR